MMTIMADDGVRGHEFSYDRGSADRYTLRSITRLRLLLKKAAYLFGHLWLQLKLENSDHDYKYIVQ